MMKLSIIIPVYNVEKYIRTCLESIFKQGLSDEEFEVILINDGTPDNSMEVITDIVCNHHNIHIINQPNQGVSVARNNGIRKAQGEYILMIDPDDLLIEHSVPNLLEIAIEKKADLVVADFIKMNDDEIAKFSGATQETFNYVEKDREQLFLEDLNPYECYIWHTLFRREFLQKENITFVPNISVCEDVIFINEAYTKAQRCIKAKWLLNIYRIDHTSATSSFNIKKLKDICFAIGKTCELRETGGLSKQMITKLENDIYDSFNLFVYTMLHAVKTSKERKEIFDYLIENAPLLEFGNSFKKRFESTLFKHSPYLYLKIREWHWWWIHKN